MPASARWRPLRGTWFPCAAGSVFVLLSGYLAMVALIALVLATAQGASFSLGTVLVAALAGWLAAYQVPLSLGDAVLTPLPLLPTLLVGLLIAMTASRVVRRADDEGRGGAFSAVDSAYSIVLVMALTHAVTGAGIALLLGCASVLDASVYCAAGATLAATAGVARRCGLLDWLRESVPVEVRLGLRSGLIGLAAAVGAGLLVLCVALVVAASRLVAALSAGPVGDAFGQSLLSLAYVPNAAFAAWSFATGTGFSLGEFTIQPFQLTVGPVPDLPLFAVLPRHGPAPWWPVVYLLPLVVGGLVGWSCRRHGMTPLRGFGVVGVAAAVTALGALLLAGLAGGRLGGGAFDPMTLRPGLLAALTFCWVGLPASAVAWFAGAPPHELEEEPEFDERSEWGEPAESEVEHSELDDDVDDEWNSDESDPDESDPDESDADSLSGDWSDEDWWEEPESDGPGADGADSDEDWFDEESLEEESLDELPYDGNSRHDGNPWHEGDSRDEGDRDERVEIPVETVEEINSIEFDS